MRSLVIAMGVSAALLAGQTRATTTTVTYNLGAAGSGTFFAGDSSTQWIA